MGKKTEHEELKKRLDEADQMFNEAADNIEAIEFKTKVDLFEDVAKRILPVRLADPNSGTPGQCIDWTMRIAWSFAERMYEFVIQKAQEQQGNKNRTELKTEF